MPPFSPRSTHVMPATSAGMTPERCWPTRQRNPPALSRHVANDLRKPGRNPRQSLIVNLVGSIARQMVVVVAKQSGIRDHDRGDAEPSKRPVIRPGDAGND